MGTPAAIPEFYSKLPKPELEEDHDHHDHALPPTVSAATLPSYGQCGRTVVTAPRVSARPPADHVGEGFGAGSGRAPVLSTRRDELRPVCSGARRMPHKGAVTGLDRTQSSDLCPTQPRSAPLIGRVRLAPLPMPPLPSVLGQAKDVPAALYVEQHQIRDRLYLLVKQLVSQQLPDPAAVLDAVRLAISPAACAAACGCEEDRYRSCAVETLLEHCRARMGWHHESLEEIFASIDTDGSKDLSLEELAAVFQRLGVPVVDTEQLQSVLDDLGGYVYTHSCY